MYAIFTDIRLFCLNPMSSWCKRPFFPTLDSALCAWGMPLPLANQPLWGARPVYLHCLLIRKAPELLIDDPLVFQALGCYVSRNVQTQNVYVVKYYKACTVVIWYNICNLFKPNVLLSFIVCVASMLTFIHLTVVLIQIDIVQQTEFFRQISDDSRR